MKNMSKARRIYTLIGITSPLALLTSVLSLAKGNVLVAIVFTLSALSYNILALRKARILKKQNRSDRYINRKYGFSQWREASGIAKIVLLSVTVVLFGSVGNLIFAVFRPTPVYLILAAVWFLLISASEFFFAPILTDPSYYDKQK